MTIKRQWMLILVLSIIISIGFNSSILSILINHYFVQYTKSSYDEHFSQIVEFSEKALVERNYTNRQLKIQLEAHLRDPIYRIELFRADGRLLADVVNNSDSMNSMMTNGFMNLIMGPPTEEIDTAEIIEEDGSLLGQLKITRYSSLGNSLDSRMFITNLIGISVFSFLVVLVIMLVVGRIVSKKTSKDLINTASFALSVDMGRKTEFKLSKVKEIRIIQQSLKTLESRLKLKQKSRKRLTDEIIHQARTPLTILKTHIEGFADGMIKMSSEELKICEEQIDTLTSMISEMNRAIDAEKESDTIKEEEFELNKFLKQIKSGLKAQFDKKKIDLKLIDQQKVILKTDRNKLSQCIYNLLTNAYKFTKPNGQVLIRYEKATNFINITVEDTGSGINEEDKRHLFDAYFRGAYSFDTEGEGLGLFIVKQNIDAMHGTIEVESELGKGSKFIIKIPVSSPNK